MLSTRSISSAPIDSNVPQFNTEFIYPTYPRPARINIGPPVLRSPIPYLPIDNKYNPDTTFRFPDYPNTCLINIGPPALRNIPTPFYIGSAFAVPPPNTFFQFPIYPKLPLRIGIGPVPQWFSLPLLGYHTAVRLNFAAIITSDALTISEASTRFVELPVSDSLTLSETVTFVDINKSNIQVSDTITITETVDPSGSVWVRSVTDTITLTDQLNRRVDITVVDTISITENVSFSDGKNLFATDAIAITEGLTVLNTVQRIKDTLHPSESVFINYSRRLIVTDNISLSETVGLRDLPQENVSDTLDLGENIGRRYLPNGTPIVDKLVIADFVTVNIVLNITVGDCLTLIDKVGRSWPQVVTDTITIVEAIKKYWTVIDTIRITESIGTNAAFNALCSTVKIPDKSPLIDTLTITDTVNIGIKTLNIIVTDSITPTDSAVLLP